MAMTFRNIDASPDDPVETWPFEGVLVALERGSLPEWRRLSDAVRRAPWGHVARYVEQVVEVAHPFGVSEVMADVVASARQEAREQERQLVAAEVRALVARSGRTSAQFAADVGTSPSRLSTYLTGRVAPSSTMMLRMRRAAGQG